MTVASEVVVYFDLSANGGDYFTLNDITKGVLDGATYKLGGLVATDISGYVAGFSIYRGRSAELDEFPSGGCSVRLHAYSGDLIPEGFVSGGTYSTNVLPGKRVQIKTAGVVVFDGIIQDWLFAYDATTNSATAEFTADDSLGALGRRSLETFTTTIGQSSGTRIAAVLARPEIDWGVNVSLDNGIATLQGDTVSEGTNALTYCQTVARTEVGRFYCDRTGILAFRERYNTIGLTSTSTGTQLLDETGAPILDEAGAELLDESVPFTLNPDVSAAVTLTDDDTAFRFSSASLAYGSTSLYTDVSITREGGTVQAASNSAARDAYGIRRLDLSGLLMQTDEEAYAMAEWLTGVYSTPSTRFQRLVINLGSLTSAQQSTVAGLDIASVVTVKWTPRGAAAQLDMNMVIEGMEHNNDVGSPYLLALSLSPVSGAEVFRLDDDVLGILDSGVLAF